MLLVHTMTSHGAAFKFKQLNLVSHVFQHFSYGVPSHFKALKGTFIVRGTTALLETADQ